MQTINQAKSQERREYSVSKEQVLHCLILKQQKYLVSLQTSGAPSGSFNFTFKITSTTFNLHQHQYCSYHKNDAYRPITDNSRTLFIFCAFFYDITSLPTELLIFRKNYNLIVLPAFCTAAILDLLLLEVLFHAVVHISTPMQLNEKQARNQRSNKMKV